MGVLDMVPRGTKDVKKTYKNLRGNIIAGAIAVAIFSLVAIGSGAGFELRSAVIMFLLFVGFSVITRQSGDYTIGFVIISLGLIFVFADYFAPGFLVEPFSPLVSAFDQLVGVDVSQVQSWQFLVLAIVSVFFVIAARVRYGASAGVWIDRVFDRTLREFQKYIDNYLNFARLFAVFLFGVLLIVMQQLGLFLGLVGDVLEQVPFITSNFVIGLAGYASLGGDLVLIESLPLFGTLTANDFAIFTILVIAVAAAVKYQSSGPLARFVR